MKTAALTMVYNESVNLPIWQQYYAREVGGENLFTIDDGSTDGSTDNLPNVIRLPRGAYDAVERAAFISQFAGALLSRYDTVIYADADELVVPDLSRYSGLRDYLAKNTFDFRNCIGLNVIHVLSEWPLDTDFPILPQRRYAIFRSPTSKPLITRVPLRWAPGFHACDRAPQFDPDLFVFHTAAMDYGLSMARHRLNSAVEHPTSGRAATMGAHWRYDNARFVREAFLDPMNLAKNGPSEFDFTHEIAEMTSRAEFRDGFYLQPMDLMKLVAIPAYMRNAF